MRTKPLRNFHNIIKTILIDIYSEKQRKKLQKLFPMNQDNKLSILDIGCGKGNRFTKEGI
jgi:2-polyprenyl-3-methyl-5-hydroxy-6-metoxy-1,4-benzoquinol methylase